MGDEIDNLAEGRKLIADLIGDVLGPGAQEMGATIADQARLFRWKRSIGIIERAKKFAKERGIKPQQIPYNFLVPFLEKSSLSDEEESLTDAWANLLVSAAAGPDARHRLFTDLLAELDSNEADLLKALFFRVRPELERHMMKYSYGHQTATARMRLEKYLELHAKKAINFTDDAFRELMALGNLDNSATKLVNIGISIRSNELPVPPIQMEDGLVGENFDVFHLERLDLLHGETFIFNAPYISFLEVGGVDISYRMSILTNLGYQFVATCEGISLPDPWLLRGGGLGGA